jgi:hypothetical protein
MREDAERDRDPRSDADAANKLRLIADWRGRLSAMP